MGGVKPKMEGTMLVARPRVSHGWMAYGDARLLPALRRRCHVGQVLDDLLGIFCLPGSRLPAVGEHGRQRAGSGGQENQAQLGPSASRKSLQITHVQRMD